MGALGASAAASVIRVVPVRAANGDPVLLGDVNLATATTEVRDSDGSNHTVALLGHLTHTAGSGDGAAVMGLDDGANGTGVKGFAPNGPTSIGVLGYSNEGFGVYGYTFGPGPGIYGAGGTGVYGHSSASSDQPAAPGKTGVFGFADQDVSASGVRGQSVSGNGVRGQSVSGNGVLGLSGSSVGVRGQSTTGRGGSFKGKAAQVRLEPSPAASHPPQGRRGDLFVDQSGRLWFCKGSATWVQLA
jgi:hypothetical protein